ncbi:hypothetical protein CTAYLR_007247 [Chrysophaeum taylorii]|uniref:OBG-type G domain-containing protein n=1 Tax=Chrysophaeum taylorii TaxID=2483200 RepID=A0AAD7XMF4_9STRA|nr:hypothetical protein CTAYLR_007247 [Chrysophaeum taylorii]
MGIVEKIKELEQEYARTQKNKATEGHLGIIKARLAKLRGELLAESSGGGGGGEGFSVQKSGDGRVALIGFPSVGKSSLLSELTDTESVAAGYEFTTLTCIPGNLVLNGVRIQLLDLPGIIEGAAHGKGRGREVIAVARTADLVLMVLDAGKEGVNRHREILETELETVGLRLNKRPPNVTLVKKKTGGVKFNATVPLTKLGSDPHEAVLGILREYKMHNCELLVREDITSDELIDVINGNRKYVRCLYAYNKIDQITIEEIDALARQPHSVVISVHAKLNLDYLLQKMWDYMGLIRVYSKRRGAPPDLQEPVVLSTQRPGGITVEAATRHVSRELLVIFSYCMVWGTSVKFSPQRVGLQHVLDDEDVFQIVAKTNNQQKLDKDYSQRVQAYNKMIAEKRKTRTKEGKKKRSTG